MLDALCNIADQICMFVVAVGKAILPGFCGPLVDLYGQCIYSITGAIRGIDGSGLKGAAVAGAIGIGGIVATGYIGPKNQAPANLLGKQGTTTTVTTDGSQPGSTPVTQQSGMLPGWTATTVPGQTPANPNQAAGTPVQVITPAKV